MAVVGSNGVGFTFNGTMTGKEITGVATYNTLSNARIQAVKTTSPPRIQP
jgi:hypothetical protein